jgi:hypothetical protein
VKPKWRAAVEILPFPQPDDDVVKKSVNRAYIEQKQMRHDLTALFPMSFSVLKTNCTFERQDFYLISAKNALDISAILAAAASLKMND